MILKQPKMGDNFRQQRQRRTDGAIRSTADRRPMGKDRSLAPETAQASQGGKTSQGRPQSAGRHFVDSAQRRSLAGSARGIPLIVHLLAAASRLGRARGLAHHLARIPGGIKPSGARARSGWWWSTAKVFLRESSFTLLPRTKSGSLKRRSRRSA